MYISKYKQKEDKTRKKENKGASSRRFEMQRQFDGLTARLPTPRIIQGEYVRF